MPPNPTNNLPAKEGRPTWLEIDPQAVVNNFLLAKSKVGPQVDLFPVVKADAYGLGAIPLGQAMIKAGATGLCVALVEEGEILRQAGIQVPLVLFAGLTPGTEQKIIDLDLRPFIYDLNTAHSLNKAALKAGRRITCFVKVDTGMGRMGFPRQNFSNIIKELLTLPGLHIPGIVSHFACADEGEQGEVTQGQVAAMQSVLMEAEAATIKPGFHALANSAGILYHPDSHLNWVRPGIMLYGASPAHPLRSHREDGISPVVKWLSQIIQIRSVPANTALGYGHTYTTQKPSRIAQIPVGYGDGYARLLSNRGHVLIAGKKAPIIGRVCMDLTTVDITHISDAHTGSRVTLLGQDGEA
jgi:alanine racemase